MRDNEVDTKKKIHVRKWRWFIDDGDDEDRGVENNFQVSSLVVALAIIKNRGGINFA